jgi:hypothetical protein
MVRIGKRELGLWLAAMVSHVNPDCELVLYSSHETTTGTSEDKIHIGSGSYLAPLGRFFGGRLQVFRKDSNGAGNLADIFPALKRLQMRRISEDLTFRSWFIGSVLVPLVLGADP